MLDAGVIRTWRKGGLAPWCVVVLMACLPGEALAQARGEIGGWVRDAEGRPVMQVQVFDASVGRRTLTDGEGWFVLRQLGAGRHRLQFSAVGYAPEWREVVVPATGGRASVEVVLLATPLSLPGIQVTATPGGGDPRAVPQATTELAGSKLERELGATVAQTLAAQAGIAVRSMGPAASMPVMRGLTGDRIVVLQDGQRSADLAGSADDHGVTIDPLSAQRIEVVRGPATLLYGNNALGGVINVISGDVPWHVPGRVEWVAAAQAETAQPGASSAVRVALPRGERWAVVVRGGARRSADVRIPRDPVLGERIENSDARSWNAAVGAGYVGTRFRAGGALRAYDFAYGLPQPPGANPVRLRGRRLGATGRVEAETGLAALPLVRLEATAQDYGHDELDDASGERLQTFALDTRTVDLLVRQGAVGPVLEGAWGVSGLFKEYAATGPAALTPAADSRGIGLFAFEEIALWPGGPALQLGGRLDHYRIASRSSAKFGPGRERAFRALSGSGGLRVPFGGGASVAFSVASSFRAPAVEELFSGAAHAGTGAVEFGNAELEAERGLGVEGVLRVQNDRVNGQVAVYRNRISGFVHLAERGDTVVQGARLPVLTYVQDRATLQGAEGSLEWAARGDLVLGLTGDIVRAEQADGTPLSFMPPPRLGALARWDDGTVSLGGDAHYEFRQDRVGKAGERPTPAHATLRVHAGYRLRTGGGLHSISLRAENLTNELHREATSRIKDFAPGPGRNIAAVYRFVF